MALTDCYAWSNLMRINEQALITGPGILSGSSGIFRVMESAGDCQIDILDCFILWMFLEREKGSFSNYFQYFQSLPETFSIPLCFEEDWVPVLPAQIRNELKKEYNSFNTRFEKLKAIVNKSRYSARVQNGIDPDGNIRE